MSNLSSNTVAESLATARRELVEFSSRAAEANDWDKARTALEGARQIADILRAVNEDGESPATPPSRVSRNGNGSGSSQPTPSHEQMPYYFVEDGKLVKVGRSRKGGTYRHRVPRDHFELIVRKLATIAHQGEFETEELAEQCGVPRHEPLIVLDMLRKHGFLNKVRRGRWRVVNAATVRQDAESAWDRLARDSGR